MKWESEEFVLTERARKTWKNNGQNRNNLPGRVQNTSNKNVIKGKLRMTDREF